MEPSGGGFRWRFPPPIFSGGSLLPLCLWFSVFPPPPLEKRRGAFYISVFRSRGCSRSKDRCKRGHEGRNRWAHVAWYCSRGLTRETVEVLELGGDGHYVPLEGGLRRCRNKNMIKRVSFFWKHSKLGTLPIGSQALGPEP